MGRGALFLVLIAVTVIGGFLLVERRSPEGSGALGQGPVAIPAGAYRASLRCLRAQGGAESTTFAVGEVVRAELTLINATNAVRNDPNSILAWQLDVVRADGSSVRVDERPTAAAATIIAIQPGVPYASQRYWPLLDAQGKPVAPGGYILRAVSVAGVVEAPITVVPAQR